MIRTKSDQNKLWQSLRHSMQLSSMPTASSLAVTPTNLTKEQAIGNPSNYMQTVHVQDGMQAFDKILPSNCRLTFDEFLTGAPLQR